MRLQLSELCRAEPPPSQVRDLKIYCAALKLSSGSNLGVPNLKWLNAPVEFNLSPRKACREDEDDEQDSRYNEEDFWLWQYIYEKRHWELCRYSTSLSYGKQWMARDDCGRWPRVVKISWHCILNDMTSIHPGDIIIMLVITKSMYSKSASSKSYNERLPDSWGCQTRPSCIWIVHCCAKGQGLQIVSVPERTARTPQSIDMRFCTVGPQTSEVVSLFVVFSACISVFLPAPGTGLSTSGIWCCDCWPAENFQIEENCPIARITIWSVNCKKYVFVLYTSTDMPNNLHHFVSALVQTSPGRSPATVLKSDRQGHQCTVIMSCCKLWSVAVWETVAAYADGLDCWTWAYTQVCTTCIEYSLLFGLSQTCLSTALCLSANSFSMQPSSKPNIWAMPFWWPVGAIQPFHVLIVDVSR